MLERTLRDNQSSACAQADVLAQIHDGLFARPVALPEDTIGKSANKSSAFPDAAMIENSGCCAVGKPQDIMAPLFSPQADFYNFVISKLVDSADENGQSPASEKMPVAEAKAEGTLAQILNVHSQPLEPSLHRVKIPVMRWQPERGQFAYTGE